MNTPHIPDDDFERDRKVVSAAYAAARGAHDGPPSAIDAAIRAAARRAVNAGPHKVERPWINRWTKPLSVAAVVVLSASIIFVALDENPALLEQPRVAPTETKIAEAPAESPVETRAETLAGPQNPVASPAPAALQDQQARHFTKDAPRAAKREADRGVARDAFAGSSAAPPTPVVITEAQEAKPVAPPEVQIIAPRARADISTDRHLANAVPVAPPVYAPPAPPAPAAPPASAAPAQATSEAAPVPATAALAGLAKKKSERAAETRAEAEFSRAAIAEPKVETLTVTGTKADQDQQAAKPIANAGASSARAVVPVQSSPAPRQAPQALSAKESTSSHDFDRLREFRARMQWKEFDELLAQVEKRWPGLDLPPDIAAAKRDREMLRGAGAK